MNSTLASAWKETILVFLSWLRLDAIDQNEGKQYRSKFNLHLLSDYRHSLGTIILWCTQLLLFSQSLSISAFNPICLIYSSRSIQWKIINNKFAETYELCLDEIWLAVCHRSTEMIWNVVICKVKKSSHRWKWSLLNRWLMIRKLAHSPLENIYFVNWRWEGERKAFNLNLEGLNNDSEEWEDGGGRRMKESICLLLWEQQCDEVRVTCWRFSFALTKSHQEKRKCSKMIISKL